MAVVKMNFLSKMLGFQTNITICLPSFSFADAYNGRSDVYVPGMKYQVLYLLHGGSGMSGLVQPPVQSFPPLVQSGVFRFRHGPQASQDRSLTPLPQHRCTACLLLLPVGLRHGRSHPGQCLLPFPLFHQGPDSRG